MEQVASLNAIKEVHELAGLSFANELVEYYWEV